MCENFDKLAVLPKSPSSLSPANGPRTPLQPAKATGVIYNASELILTPPPTPPKSQLKTGPPKGIRGSTVNKVNRSPTQDAIRREQSPGDHASDSLHSPVSPSRLRYSAVCQGILIWKMFCNFC